MRLGLIIAAATVYLVVLGCVIFPAQTTGKTPVYENVGSHTPLTGLPYKGIALQIQRVDWTDEYKKSIDEIAAVGADTVELVVDARQENGSSSRIYLDMRATPTPEKLIELIKHAKERKLRVILMPIVLLDQPAGNDWRGTLKPLLWEEWFDSYRDMITHFAYIAEDHHVDVLVVGSELVSTQDKIQQWTKTINAVRKIYKGQLTYSSNWDNYMQVPFWNQLDLISMNCYWKLGSGKNASVAEIMENWKTIQRDVLTFTQKQKKPMMFSEVGWCSLENAASDPWDYTRDDLPVDLDLQKRLYEAFFRSWYGNPGLGGFMVWNWEPDHGGPKDNHYTPKDKPAEKVLREWMAKPWGNQ